jgi:4-hydroxy-4-methyl-2-oxoglutarate aldolase
MEHPVSITFHQTAADVIPAELTARWQQIPTAVAVDVSGGRARIDAAIRPLLPPDRMPRLFGRAVTVRCTPPDFGSVVYALEFAGPGDVLMIDAGGDSSAAVIGDVLGGRLRQRGVVGIVCDGAVRDVASFAAWPDFAVFSRGITPRGPTSAQAGELQGSISIGGRVVRPGDLVIGDADGVCALDAALAAAVIERAENKLRLEVEWQARLAAGEAVQAIFGLPPLNRR